MPDPRFFAIRGTNEDSFGYDFINYIWKGAEKLGPNMYQMVELQGEEGIIAHQDAYQNSIMPIDAVTEDAMSTGDIAIPPAGGYSPAMGTEKPRTKKKREKGSKIIFGGKDGAKK